MMATQLLTQVLESGSRAWPDVHIAPEELRAYLESRTPQLAGDSTPYPGDLFLACACLHGDANAQRHLGALCRVGLRCALHHMRITLDGEEAVASLLAKLLVAEPGTEPRLGQYAARSELRRWLQVVAVRHVLDEKRLLREVPHIEDPLAELFLGETLEWRQADPAARRAFKEALGKVIASLSVRDRNLLRLRFDGVSTVAIGAFYGVRHSTVSRWLVRVGVAVEHGVRRELRESLRLGKRDLDSLVRSILRQVDTSICREVWRACGDGPG
jgi:RNA polymerase sigma-70 factor (ECF subfamily)